VPSPLRVSPKVAPPRTSLLTHKTWDETRTAWSNATVSAVTMIPIGTCLKGQISFFEELSVMEAPHYELMRRVNRRKAPNQS